ncbi:MAG: PA14 domain-containing protein [Sulfitobacter sp.]
MNMFTTAIAATFIAVAAHAEPLALTLADPQPDAGDLTPGLAVAYAYESVRTLAEAEEALEDARSGPPLKGLSYEDNNDGDLTLTAKSAQKVAASISGFIRFDAAGTYEVDTLSNDGLVLTIGGQEVAYYDDVHACEPSGVMEVAVPEAGWYALEATYFQRKGSACLSMDWNVGGTLAPVPDEAFAHIE